MGKGKFSSLTAALLVRKGEAAPSKVRRRRARRPSNGHAKPDTAFALVPEEMQGQLENACKIVLTLSPREYEALTLLAAKKATTREALAHGAMEAYFERLLSELGEA